jgi:hypothetical protein
VGALRASSDPAAFGVVATALSVVVIALQAWYTRRATEAAEGTLQEGLAALATAEQTALEVARSRLDARAPTITISLAIPEWPPSRPPQFQDSQAQPIGYDVVYRRPRDDDQMVMLSAIGVIRNESTFTVELAASNLCFQRTSPPAYADSDAWEYPPSIRKLVLGPGESERFCLREARSVAAWIENVDAGAVGEPGPQVIVAEIICSDRFDNGTVDNHRLELSGRPLTAVPHEAGGYTLVRQTPESPGLPVASSVRPMSRRYFHSKSRNEEFAD